MYNAHVWKSSKTYRYLLLSTVMKHTVPLLVLVALYLGCSFVQNGAADCQAFRTGTFSLKSELDRQEYLIVRNDSIQVETNMLNGRVTKWKVKWLSPCRYELWYLPEQVLTSEDSFYMSHPFVNDIITTTDSYYIFLSKLKERGYSATDTIFISK